MSDLPDEMERLLADPNTQYSSPQDLSDENARLRAELSEAYVRISKLRAALRASALEYPGDYTPGHAVRRRELAADALRADGRHSRGVKP